jgi:hypothetical protein
VYLTETNNTYQLRNCSLTVLCLADPATAGDIYDDGFVEDQDNQIDIILQGDESVMRRIRNVLVTASIPPYKPFNNPGCPGNNPTPVVTYTKPTSSIKQPVTIAIDDPMTLKYGSFPQ